MSYLEPVVDEPAVVPVAEQVPTVVPPHNPREIVAQLTLANPTNSTTPFMDRMGENDRSIRTFGSQASLADVMVADHKEKLDVIRKMASAAASVYDTENTNRLINEMSSAETTLQEVSMVDAYRATARRSLEALTAPAAVRMGADLNRFATSTEIEADYMAARQILNNAAAKAGVDASFWDKFKFFGQEVVPGLQWMSRGRQLTTITSSLGRDGIEFDKEEVISNFRNTFFSMSKDERLLVVDKLLSSDLGALGGKNSAALETLLSELAAPHEAAQKLEKAFDILSVFDVVALAKGLGSLFSRGAASTALAKGDPSAAGKALATDLLTKGGMAGDSEFALISKAFSANQSPLTVGHPALDGLSTSMQETIAEQVNSLYKSLAEKLNTSGLTPAEVKESFNTLAASMSPAANKAVHKVVFGEVDSSGMKSVVYWQDKNTGRAFSSKEAAEAALAERGGMGEVVLKNNAPAPKPDLAYHGSGAEFDEFKAGFVGRGEGVQSMGHGFSTTQNKALATNYADAYGRASTDGPVLYTVDVPAKKEMMSWTDTLADQSPSVQKGLGEVLTAGEVKELKATNGTAKDAYDMVATRLGGAEKASEAFDKAGIKGAYSADEATVYNPKNIDILETQYLERKRKGELSPEDLARKEQEQEWIRSGYGPDGNPLKESDLEFYASKPTKRVDSANAASLPTSGDAVVVGAFNEGAPLFAKGAVEFSDDVPTATRTFVSDLRKMLGYRNEDRMVVMHGTEENFNALYAHYAHEGRYIEQMYEAMVNGQAKGFFLRIPGEAQIIIVRSSGLSRPGTLEYFQTLAHEFGHSVDYTVLRKMYGTEAYTSMRSAFMDWQHSRTSAADYAITHNQISLTDVENLLKAKADQLPPEALKTLYSNPNWFEWSKSFDEWWANQFAKYVQSSENVIPSLRSTFKEVWEQIKTIAKYLYKKYGDNITEDAMVADEAVAKFLDDHIARVAAGDVIEGSFTDVARAINAEAPKTAGKPRIKLKLAKEEWLIREERFDPHNYNSIGKFSESDINSMPWIAVDPKHQASELAVEARVVGVHAEAKVRNDLSSFIKPFFDKLDNASKAKVKGVLDEGDSISNLSGSTGKEFNYMELKAKGLSEDEAAAYFAARQVRQTVYHLRNAEMVRHLRAQGMKEVVVGDQKLVGKVLQTEGEALSAHVNQGIYNVAKGEMVFYRAGDMSAAYASGSRVVKLQHPAEFNGKLYSTIVVDDTSAKVRDIYTALNYRPGEFSRIYTDEYFIRMVSTKEVDGLNKEITETIRSAASTREASEFVKAMKNAILVLKNSGSGVASGSLRAKVEALVGKYVDTEDFIKEWEAGKFDGFKDLEFSYSRNKDEYLNGALSQAQFEGRLFTDKRGDKLFSVDRTRANTLDVYQSLEAEITNISRVTNIGEWRENMVRRWMNTFGDLLPTRTGNDVADFYAAANATFTKGSKDALFAERTHRYIMRQIGVRTQEEQFYGAVTRRWTEAFLKGNEGVESVGAAIRQQSWLGFARSINFNFNLGMFNPAQLIVQANGAATALIISPKHGLAAAKTYPLLRMGLMSDNPAVWDKLATVENLTSLGLSNKQEFVDLISAVRKTGIIDNMKSTSLHNLEDGKLNVFSGYPSKVWGANTFFFNRGEEFSRLLSFDVARREWMAAHPEAKWTSKEALAQMVVRMDDLTQNMTKANLARWQEGALSIPLQFAQYNIKLAANIMSAYMGSGVGRGFTKTEATQLLIGHALFYGAAGNGLAWLVDEVVPEEMKATMSQAQKAYLAQGLFSGLLYQVSEHLTGTGANVAIGSRLGSFDYYQRIANAIFKDPTSVYQALLGPSLGTAKRLGVIGDVAYLWWKDPHLSGQDVVEGLTKMSTEQVATMRNATKAYLFYQHQGKMLDSKGVAMGQLSSVEIMGQALGFQPTLAVDIHNLIGNKKQHSEAMKDIAGYMMATQKAIILAASNGDVKRAEEQQKLLQALIPDNAGDALEVSRIIKDKLYPYDTEMQKLLGDYMLKGMQYGQPITPTTPPKGK